MNSIESLPTSWDDARDTAFFRLTSSAFAPQFVAGASALLGSYDPDVLAIVGPADDFVPVPVRRVAPRVSPIPSA